MTRVIVVEVEGKLMGMVVDSASQVVRIPADQIDPPPPVLGGFSQEFITGVGKIDDKLIILLNSDAILTAEERTQLGSLETRRTAGLSAAFASPVLAMPQADQSHSAPALAPPDARPPDSQRLGAESLKTTHRLFAAFDRENKGLEWLHGDLFDARAGGGALGARRGGVHRRSLQLPHLARLLGSAPEAVRLAAVRALGRLRHPGLRPGARRIS